MHYGLEGILGLAGILAMLMALSSPRCSISTFVWDAVGLTICLVSCAGADHRSAERGIPVSLPLGGSEFPRRSAQVNCGVLHELADSWPSRPPSGCSSTGLIELPESCLLPGAPPWCRRGARLVAPPWGRACSSDMNNVNGLTYDVFQHRHRSHYRPVRPSPKIQ